MRISDWSSDVCSSDLIVLDNLEAIKLGRDRRRDGRDGRIAFFGDIGGGTGGIGMAHRHDPAFAQEMPRLAERLRMADRKSVVQGKSVSVRVDLGGRRIIQKNTNNNRT